MSHWSDIMPTLDLGTEGGVAYRHGDRLLVTIPRAQRTAQPALDHPSGLGFALRWLELHGPRTWQENSHYGAYQAELQSILMRWLLGRTLRDDMVLVARACDEVA